MPSNTSYVVIERQVCKHVAPADASGAVAMGELIKASGFGVRVSGPVPYGMALRFDDESDQAKEVPVLLGETVLRRFTSVRPVWRQDPDFSLQLQAIAEPIVLEIFRRPTFTQSGSSFTGSRHRGGRQVGQISYVVYTTDAQPIAAGQTIFDVSLVHANTLELADVAAGTFLDFEASPAAVPIAWNLYSLCMEGDVAASTFELREYMVDTIGGEIAIRGRNSSAVGTTGKTGILSLQNGLAIPGHRWHAINSGAVAGNYKYLIALVGEVAR